MILLSFVVRLARECPEEYRGQHDVFADTVNALHQARSIEEQDIEFIGDLNPDEVRRYVECHLSDDEVASASTEKRHLYEMLSRNQRDRRSLRR
jgi:L-rhamnose mutarotase